MTKKMKELKKDINDYLKKSEYNKNKYDIFALDKNTLVVDFYGGYEACSMQVDIKKDGSYDSKLTLYRDKKNYPHMKRHKFIKRKKSKTTKPIKKLMGDWVWCECHID